MFQIIKFHKFKMLSDKVSSNMIINLSTFMTYLIDYHYNKLLSHYCCFILFACFRWVLNASNEPRDEGSPVS